MTWPESVVPGCDGIQEPVPSRVYAALLGDAHTFAPDRAMAADLLAAEPEARYWARANRAFLGRAVRYALDAGARQILDIGCGLPATRGSLHEIAWRVDSRTRIGYVDIDPVAVAHARQLLEEHNRVVAVVGDLRDPDTVVGHPELAALLDWTQPIAVILGAVLHFVSNSDDPTSILARLRDSVPDGSWLVISHASAPSAMTPEQVRAVREYSERTAPLTLRSRQQVTELLDVWGEVVEPGVCGVAFWRPEPGELDGPAEVERAARIPGWAGVAVKGAGAADSVLSGVDVGGRDVG
ncbi:SAM-dependent methyltransferase [Phytohabitans rumicis]|uniref:S-adenosyl methyltransferase n=1 Tax=Phytohabitans rumicis TaxID=1076125 RepID=A0A6V8L6M0_9ACTN|nr:SAM-dependent methyltransferase [Phytohabitans rumicis]GFJ90299.1 hypothetical protein Prum_039410 [Phytohabitans rumicis]